MPSWTPGTGCSGGTLEGDADLYWQLLLDGVDVAHSSWTQGGCPGSWNVTVCVPEASFYGTFFLGAWDEDGADDYLQDSMWWDFDGNTIADPLDPFWLHMRGYDGPTGSGGQVRVTFDVVAGCE